MPCIYAHCEKEHILDFINMAYLGSYCVYFPPEKRKFRVNNKCTKNASNFCKAISIQNRVIISCGMVHLYLEKYTNFIQHFLSSLEKSNFKKAFAD